MKDYCPQCGYETETLYEGCCEDCRDSNQSELNRFNFEYDKWQNMTDKEKDKLIYNQE